MTTPMLADAGAGPVTFALPDGAIATEPPENRGVERDAVRLLVARPSGISHRLFRQLPAELRAGDVLVINVSQTVPAEIDGMWRGEEVIVHLGTHLADGARVVEVRTGPDGAKPILDAVAGNTIALSGGINLTLVSPYPDGAASPTGTGNRLWRAVAPESRLDALVDQQGRPIAYGYLRGRYPLRAYQTTFGIVPGSAEMPSAARPFTPALVTELVSRGIRFAPVVLHTGLSSQESGEPPQPEPFAINAATADLIEFSRRAGGRVIAVGTSATRAVESAVDRDGRVVPRSGWTDRVVTPAAPPVVVNGLITGWHDPQASHLQLVQAVAGHDLTDAAYRAAVAERYRWHEFGDSCLLLPEVAH